MRLFFAIWPNDAIRASLAEWRDRWTWPRDATPVADDKLHITLHFMGEVPEDRLSDLMSSAEVPFSQFEVRIDQSVLWHHGIAVLEPSDVPIGLTGLHAQLGSNLEAAGFALEQRPYRPHVTMARRAARAIPPNTPPPPLPWHVNQFCLMRSHTGHNAGYEVLKRWTTGP